MTAPDEFDGIIIMGRPVDPNFQEIVIALKAGVDLSEPYPDSVKKNCARCNREIWIGPRSMDVANYHGNAYLCCPVHAAEMAAEKQAVHADSIEITSLGNVHPNDPRP